MDDEIDDLFSALAASPDNVPLRLILAGTLAKGQRWQEVEAQCRDLLARDGGNRKAKQLYARAALALGKFGVFEVIAEELGDAELDALRPALPVPAGAVAGDIVPQDDPDDLDADDPDDPDAGADAFGIEKPDLDFSGVGGMDDVKEQIRRKIILPLEKPELFAAYGKKAGGGILLYGPPGCGKTHIAKATAGQINAAFIVAALDDLLDKWLGESEKRIHALFETARRRAPCVLFIDEIDALGAKRGGASGSIRTDVNQFLAELDGVTGNNEGVLVLGATNMPWALDTAFRRPGRFDRLVFVPPPDERARAEILRIHCAGKPSSPIDFAKVAGKTKLWSGADLRGLVDSCVEAKIEESLSKGSLQPIGTDDLLKALKGARPSTGEWLATARNHALYSNIDGVYDDVAEYLGVKR